MRKVDLYLRDCTPYLKHQIERRGGKHMQNKYGNGHFRFTAKRRFPVARAIVFLLRTRRTFSLTYG